MSCPGLHCPGCGNGGGKVVLYGGGVVVVVLAVEWVASHAWEILAVSAGCGVLAVAAVVALMRWGDRREARHAAERPFLVARETPAALPPARRPAIAPAVVFNFYGADSSDMAASVIRTAIERNDNPGIKGY